MAKGFVLTAIDTRKTKRLTLRQPIHDDLGFMVALFAKPEMVAHRPNPTPDSAETSSTRLQGEIDHWQRHGFGRWAIEESGRLIGFGGLTHKAGFQGLNLSYHLDPTYWGKGYASELAEEAISVAFTILKADRVIGLVRPANPTSKRVLERAGFKLEKEVLLDGAVSTLWVRYPGADD